MRTEECARDGERGPRPQVEKPQTYRVYGEDFSAEDAARSPRIARRPTGAFDTSLLGPGPARERRVEAPTAAAMSNAQTHAVTARPAGPASAHAVSSTLWA